MKSGLRIRYVKTKNDGILKSYKSMKAKNGATYSVFLNENEGIYKILNVKSRHYVAEGSSKSKNLHVLKRLAKEKLKELGVSFENMEIRDNSSRIPGENCAYKQSDRKNANET